MASSQQIMSTVVYSSKTNEYYTPARYIAAAREAMGGIDLDPASCEAAQLTVQAGEYWTEKGRQRNWYGKVWLNPPYGRLGNRSSQGVWGMYLLQQYQAGNVEAGILLCKSAFGYNWFEELWDVTNGPVCFARYRIRFVRSDGEVKGMAKQGTSFFYFGKEPDRFIAAFSPIGRVVSTFTQNPSGNFYRQ